MIPLKKFLIETHFYLSNSRYDLSGLPLFLSLFFLFFLFFFFYLRVSRETRAQIGVSKTLSSSQLVSDTERRHDSDSDMITLENSRRSEEEVNDECEKLVFKFSYQTETLERFNREGYRGDDGDGDLQCSSPSTSMADTVVEESERESLRVEESFKESFEGKESLVNGETEYSVSENTSGNLFEEENMDFPEKIDFLTPNDFLESTDSDSEINSTQTFTIHDEGFLSDSDFDEYGSYETSPKNNSDEQSNQNEKTQEKDLDSEEDSNGLESLWEHQDLIEQLKMEMKKVKASGLPTIHEDEDEYPKIVEDLKPWRIEDKKLRHVDTISELHKFYKSYRERMRKLDILSFQKIYALGLVQSKDPLQAISAIGSFPSYAGSSVFPNLLRLCKPENSETDPTVKFMRETYGELENVYVGQMCLSWEFLHWQYEKAIELLESDPYEVCRYNEIAGEFQQFQVLIQRFLENEPFEGRRIPHYIKKRCVHRNLLQVPVIRQDGTKDKRQGRRGRDLDDDDDNAIKSEHLVHIMEESIRLFWRFVRSDKYMSSIHRRSRTKSQIEPQETEELEMFSTVKSNLQKKEKRLKDVLKSEKCIMRRLKKEKEETSSEDQVLHFFSQVDMRLVTRVLNMSKLTRDHLLWCHHKLNKIHFVNRRIHFDSSFCLFPC